jgi:exodeoxyribonuclease-5
MDFSPQQDEALKAIAAWLKKPNGGEQVFYLGGYAGTGKTTLAKHFAADVKGFVMYMAFTGKAAMVMRSKGCDGASTIHSSIYKAKEVRPGVFHYYLDEGSSVKDAKLVIVDEVSMVNEELGNDLLSFGTKVLVLGDPAQLPPVKGTGYFTKGDPDYMLTEVHRQARDNPIIRMSMLIREGGYLNYGVYGSSRVVKVAAIETEDVVATDQILVGLNKTRHNYNARMRQILGHFDFGLLDMPAGPKPGEKLVCLKNKRPVGLLNGSLWAVVEAKDKHRGKYAGYEMIVRPLDEGMGDQNKEVWTPVEFFTGEEGRLEQEAKKGCEEFTYGYALTVHKAQGSQWNNVFLFDQSMSFRDEWARWLYTGITRAAERITIVRGED